MTLDIILYKLLFVTPRPFTSTDGTYCEQGWIGFMGKCYYFHEEVGTFQDHEEFCASRDAHLASILDSTHSYVEKWTTNFIRAIHKGMLLENVMPSHLLILAFITPSPLQM